MWKVSVEEIQQIEEELQEIATKQVVIEGYDLDRIRGFMAHLGNPQDQYDIIHVGGTAGKGSTTQFISRILQAHARKTGAYYSPHIVSPGERIHLNNTQISKEAFIELYTYIKQQAASYFQGVDGRHLTYFEFLLAMAFVYFARQEVDCLVLEVGLGGKLDPTNIVDSQLAVITNVGLDHMKLLGDTVEQIAQDKVQIVKPATTCISGVEQSSVTTIVREYCEQQDATLLVAGSDFTSQITDRSFDSYQFGYHAEDCEIDNLRVRMIGDHQVTNATLAICAATTYLKQYNQNVMPAAIRQAVVDAVLPGRITCIARDPKIIVDVAHNGEKMQAVVATLQELTDDTTAIRLLVACKRGKDHELLLEPLQAIASSLAEVVVTSYAVTQDTPHRSAPIEQYANYLTKLLPTVQISSCPDATQAFQQIHKRVAADELLLVTGSFYLLQALRPALQDADYTLDQS